MGALDKILDQIEQKKTTPPCIIWIEMFHNRIAINIFQNRRSWRTCCTHLCSASKEPRVDVTRVSPSRERLVDIRCCSASKERRVDVTRRQWAELQLQHQHRQPQWQCHDRREQNSVTIGVNRTVSRSAWTEQWMLVLVRVSKIKIYFLSTLVIIF